MIFLFVEKPSSSQTFKFHNIFNNYNLNHYPSLFGLQPYPSILGRTRRNQELFLLNNTDFQRLDKHIVWNKDVRNLKEESHLSIHKTFIKDLQCVRYCVRCQRQKNEQDTENHENILGCNGVNSCPEVQSEHKRGRSQFWLRVQDQKSSPRSFLALDWKISKFFSRETEREKEKVEEENRNPLLLGTIACKWVTKYSVNFYLSIKHMLFYISTICLQNLSLKTEYKADIFVYFFKDHEKIDT